MAVKMKCPECERKFLWDMRQGWPERCPLPDCGFSMSLDGRDEVVMPAILGRRTKVADKVYRDMEAGSERRVEMAAELTGGTKEEFAGLKITNLNDRNDAEMAAMPVRNAVTEHMERFKQGGFTGGEAVGYSGAVQTGPFPNAGAKMRTNIQQHHATLSQGAAVCDRPAVETTQPGYRRRG